MTWAGTAIAVGSAAVGAVNANQQRKAQQKANQQNANISAAQQQYSPWTGVNPSTPNIQATPDNTFGAAAQGALGGAMFGINMNNKLKKPEDPDFADSNFMADAKPIGATTPMTNDAPGMDADGLEDALRKDQEMQYFQRGMKKKNAYGQMA